MPAKLGLNEDVKDLRKNIPEGYRLYNAPVWIAVEDQVNESYGFLHLSDRTQLEIGFNKSGHFYVYVTNMPNHITLLKRDLDNVTKEDVPKWVDMKQLALSRYILLRVERIPWEERERIKRLNEQKEKQVETMEKEAAESLHYEELMRMKEERREVDKFREWVSIWHDKK